jgi:hypothetical protein
MFQNPVSIEKYVPARKAIPDRAFKGGSLKRILHLNLHREFFAAIAAKTKRIEYRARTSYWQRRLEGRHYDLIHFRNGYATKSPEMLVEFRGLRRYGNGPNAYYAIRLGRILKTKRWKP